MNKSSKGYIYTGHNNKINKIPPTLLSKVSRQLIIENYINKDYKKYLFASDEANETAGSSNPPLDGGRGQKTHHNSSPNFFENTPEAPDKSLYEGFQGVSTNLFAPYKTNAELYFKSINHNSSYNNINKITIEAESLYDSAIDHKGMFVVLDEKNIKTYESVVSSILTNDVFYFESDNFFNRGYYFYTGLNLNASNGSSGPSGPSTNNKITILPENSPTGVNSFFTKNFYFKGDLEYDINENIRLFSTEMKNSTIEYSKDGINYNILEFSISFNRRTNQEARAILKFLDDKAGFKIFSYTLPQPYNKTISVYCPEWNHTYNFINNNDISVKFIEFKNPANPVALFNTQIRLI